MLFVIFAFNKASDSNLKKKMFDLIITVAVTFIVYHLLIAAYSYCRVLKIVKNIPTLPSIPFLGVALQFYKIKSPNGNHFAKLFLDLRKQDFC